MMVKLLRLLAIVLIVSSCSKNNGSNGGSSGVVLPDTLTTGWTKVTGLPNENFNDIFFADNSNGFAVSNNGIYRSADGGDTWIKLTSTNAIGFTNIGAGTNNNACFVNKSYDVLVTQDAGNTISKAVYAYPGGGNVAFFDCFFSSPATCFLTSKEFIWKSVNAAVNLDTVYHFPTISETSSLFFLDDMQGWVLRQDGIYQTIDGGTTWAKDTALVNAYGSIQFIDSNNGYFSNYGTVNKTTDGGITWVPVYESTLKIFFDIAFIDINEGYFSFNNKIYKTSDAGTNWTPVVALGNELINKICFTDVNHGWACTSDGVIVKYVQ